MTTTPRPAFSIKHNASIKHINVRKEGEEGNEVLALDLKLQFKGLDRRLCAYFDEALEAFLWRGDTDALIARNQFLSPVQYSNYVSGAHVSIGGRDFDGSDVKKFSITPKDGGVIDLTCSVTLGFVTTESVAFLSGLLHDEGRVEITGPLDLFDADLVPIKPVPTVQALPLEQITDGIYALPWEGGAA